MSKHPRILTLILMIGVLTLVVACGEAGVENNDDNSTTDEQPTSAPAADSGYPASDSASGYPGPDLAYPGAGQDLENLSDEPPNPERSLPEAGADSAVVGGVLVREVTGSGFVPLDPFELILAEVVYGSENEVGLVRYNDQSQRAETFPTGIFVFNDITPGTYALVVNLGVTEFPIMGEDGTELILTLEAGDVQDVGQLFVEIP